MGGGKWLPIPGVDALVMETTYGDGLHKPLQPSVEEFYPAIEDAFPGGGNVICAGARP